MTPDVSGWIEEVQRGVADAAPRAGAFARHVTVRACTGSTNDDASAAAAQGAPEGYTVIAAEQTAGRGRRGASWHSPPLHGLYLSTVLRPDRWPAVRERASTPAATLVTLMAGVAVAGAVHAVSGVAVELKWPNDVMARVPAAAAGTSWRKLAGILAEGASDGARLRTVVVGIGLNLRPSHAPDEVAARMITLADLVGHHAEPLPLRGIVAALLERLADGCDRLAQGRTDHIRVEWTRLAPSVAGTRVRWHRHGVAEAGWAAGIDEYGALRVRREDHGEALVHGGDVEWIFEPEGT